MRSRAQLAAENLFLRKQLALYQERRVKPRRADDPTRIVLDGLSRLLEWRQLLVIVKPETLIRWFGYSKPATARSGFETRANTIG
jgi:putative transposase